MPLILLLDILPQIGDTVSYYIKPLSRISVVVSTDDLGPLFSLHSHFLGTVTRDSLHGHSPSGRKRKRQTVTFAS